ncbi:Glutamate--tRNA ligase [Frankliniella fusca]|uniref:Glutamate--tRNA ligase n=1 Tax=Frankliniella fusca TaxID=407009 RepID=A0AAE1HEM5_9NEOP|nr:Glutamate--tRNA ligase [Frankliniella fusca]
MPTSSDAAGPEYYVVLSEIDNTYSTIPACDVMSDGLTELEVGDSVQFFWNKVRHSGPIQHFGDDFKACNKLAEKLTVQMKSALKRSGSGSFSLDRPRKCKVKGLERIRKRKRSPSPSKSTKISKSNKKTRGESKLRREVEEGAELISQQVQLEDNLDSTLEISGSGESNASVSSDQSDDSPGPRRSKADITKQKELEEKVRQLSAQLAAQTASAVTPIKSAGNASLMETPVTKNVTPKQVKETGKSQATPSSNSYSIYLSTASKPFAGEMLRFDCSTEDSKQLLGHESKELGVFCEALRYTAAESCGSATAAARHLLPGVFTEAAIISCSITGLPPRGKGKQAYADISSIKPHLCPKAVRAIIDQALEWQRVKYLRPKKDAGKIRTAMSIMLCELRKKIVAHQLRN